MLAPLCSFAEPSRPASPAPETAACLPPSLHETLSIPSPPRFGCEGQKRPSGSCMWLWASPWGLLPWLLGTEKYVFRSLLAGPWAQLELSWGLVPPSRFLPPPPRPRLGSCPALHGFPRLPVGSCQSKADRCSWTDGHGDRRRRGQTHRPQECQRPAHPLVCTAMRPCPSPAWHHSVPSPGPGSTEGVEAQTRTFGGGGRVTV